MAFKDTIFISQDNTGLKKAKCIKVYYKNNCVPGSIILVTLKNVYPNRKIKKGQLFKAVVVRLKKNYQRFYNFNLRYNINAIVLLKKNELVPLGTRIYGSVYYEIRLLGFMKIVSLCSYIL